MDLQANKQKVIGGVSFCAHILLVLFTFHWQWKASAKKLPSKIEGLRIGGNKNHMKWTVFGTYGGIDWENDKVRFLGGYIGEKIDELNEENFHDTVQKMMQSLHFWKGKYLSRKGLPRTVNTYSQSMPFYIAERQEPSKLQIDNINKEITKIVKREKD